jgi:hypothetical protein
MVRRTAYARNEVLVAVAVIAILLGLLARTIYKVHQSVTQTQADAVQVRPADPGQPPRGSPPPTRVGPEGFPGVIPTSWTTGQGPVISQRGTR